MWLGLGGLLALAALTLLARMPERMRLHPGYRAFRKVHRWLAWAAVAGGGLHVLLTRFYLASPLQAAALALLAVAACLARRPWARIDPDPTPTVAGYLALGAVAVLGLPGADPGARRAPRFGGTAPILAMTFAHSDHPAVACTTCHHEFRDGRRSLPCMTCHVTDPTVAPLVEARFHDLCRSCHVEERAAGKVAGPTRRCVDCHLPDEAF